MLHEAERNDHGFLLERLKQPSVIVLAVVGPTIPEAGTPLVIDLIPDEFRVRAAVTMRAGQAVQPRDAVISRG
jgi:hypothetical protein